MALIPGQPAPCFCRQDILGNTIDLTQYQGRHVLLSFYRYASCPFCNLRIQEITSKFDQLRAAGIEVISVFQSPTNSILKYAGKTPKPFPIIADPEQTLYADYQLQLSWFGLLKAFVLRIPEMMKSIVFKGNLPGAMEGSINRLPADFFITADGLIAIAYYGRDIGDHLPLQHLSQFTNGKVQAI